MRFFKLLMLFIISSLLGFAQSTSELINSYSGSASWDEASKTLSFESTGVVTFSGKTVAKEHFWDVPTTVKNIIIKPNTQVTCAFHTKATCTIRGEDRESSVVYGTNHQKWDDVANVKAYQHCQFQNFGGTMRIENLTSKNPFGFHVRGWGKTMHVKDCNFLDTRGGSGNHSDGFEGGDGSTVDNCYFESGDDIFKVYFNNTITNCTVKMVQNTVPIQLGWGDYSDGAVGTFKNLTIIGNSGRGNKETYPVICGRTGRYDVTINIDSCTIVNPNAHLVMLWDDNDDGNHEKTVRGSIINAFIDIKGYSNYLKGTSLLTVCGTNEKKGDYNCLTTAAVENHIGEAKCFPNPFCNKISVEADGAIAKLFDCYGKELSVEKTETERTVTFITDNLEAGLYFIQCGNSVTKVVKAL